MSACMQACAHVLNLDNRGTIAGSLGCKPSIKYRSIDFEVEKPTCEVGCLFNLFCLTYAVCLYPLSSILSVSLFHASCMLSVKYLWLGCLYFTSKVNSPQVLHKVLLILLLCILAGVALCMTCWELRRHWMHMRANLSIQFSTCWT